MRGDEGMGDWGWGESEKGDREPEEREGKEKGAGGQGDLSRVLDRVQRAESSTEKGGAVRLLPGSP